MNHTLRLQKINKGNDHQIKEALDCSTNSPCQHLRKCLQNSMENLHTDIRVYSAVRKIFTTRTRFLENRLVNWFEGYITQGINKGINHEDVVSDV